MADVKISELPIATAIASPDVAPIVQGGVTKQADVSLFTNLAATLRIHSPGDSTNPTTFTAANSGIKLVDVNNIEMGRFWVDGEGEDIFITGRSVQRDPDPASSLPVGIPFSTGQNVVVGSSSFLNATSGAGRNTAIGTDSMFASVSGSNNTAIGNGTLSRITSGSDNIGIGLSAGPQDAAASNTILIGSNASSANHITDNVIGIGAGVTVATDNTAIIGNQSITDVYFGDTVGNAILHGKGGAIVFPDSDPHVAGAAYWVAGALVRSAG